MDEKQLSGLALAYLGDAVLELIVRERVLESGVSSVGKLNEMAREFVKASEQSKALENILPVLTEEETSYYKRGRNTKGNTPKSATACEYRRATGLESLFAHLYITGQKERMKELFDLAYKDIQINKNI